MTKYEIMVIIQNDRNEAEAKAFIKDTVNPLLEEHGAKFTFEDFWGARGFAYMINHEKWGYYYVAQFDGPATLVKAATRDLNITKGVVRFLITKVDKKAPAPVKYEDMKKNWAQKKEEDSIAEVEATAETPAKKTEPKKDDVDRALDASLKDIKL